MKYNSTLLILAVFSLLSSLPVAAEEPDAANRLNFTIGGGITAVMQGTSGNDDTTTGTRDGMDYSYTLDINMESELSPGHMLFIHIETGEGDGTNTRFPSWAVPNYDPYNTNSPDVGHQDVTVSQAFYEGLFFSGLLTLDIGKMDIHSLTDENNLAGDETTQFMSGLFSRLTGTLYPELDSYYAPGVRMLLVPTDFLEFSLVLANSKNESVGTRGYHAAQLNLKPAIGGLEGNYRFYFIRDLRPYTKISDGSSDINTGLGVSFDQMLGDNFGLFFRFGTQPDDIAENEVTSSYSGGLMLMGGLWGNADDSLGLGYGTIIKNSKIATTYSGDQQVVELFYHWQVAERIALSPDIQLHSNLPRDEKRSVVVFGLRAQLDF